MSKTIKPTTCYPLKNQNGKLVTYGHSARTLYRKEGGKWVAKEWNTLDGKKYVLKTLPASKTKIYYVSYGDSIAAGHKIDANWDAQNKLETQYGYNNNTSTEIITNTYTDLIRKELQSLYGASRVNAISFATSGDEPTHLMTKLADPVVEPHIRQADVMTLCIGANCVLTPAIDYIGQYAVDPFNDFTELNNHTTMALNRLNPLYDDSKDNVPDEIKNYPTYYDIFDRLVELNPNAKYVFTTIYNPFKYLFMNANFFDPLKNLVSAAFETWVLDIDEFIEWFVEDWPLVGGKELAYFDFSTWKWVAIELDISIAHIVNAVLDAIISVIRYKVNGTDSTPAISQWTEDIVTRLNTVIKNSIDAYDNPNFIVADTKAMFDVFPNRTNRNDDVEYNELVNCQITDNYDSTNVRWNRLWESEGKDLVTYIVDDVLDFEWHLRDNIEEILINLFVNMNLSNATDPFTYGYVTLHDTIVVDSWSSFWNMESWLPTLLSKAGPIFVTDLVENVLMNEIDVHPQTKGHAVLKRSFTNMFGLLNYNANGGSYVPGDVVLKGQNPPYVESTKTDQTFDDWYTDSGLTQRMDPESNSFVDHDSSVTLSELASGASIISKPAKTTNLYAKWSANT